MIKDILEIIENWVKSHKGTKSPIENQLIFSQLLKFLNFSFYESQRVQDYVQYDI